MGEGPMNVRRLILVLMAGAVAAVSGCSGSGDDDAADGGVDSPVAEAFCGNAEVERGEVCDDGVNDGAYGRCEPSCLDWGPRCGDYVTNGPEVCDDGNTEDGDGCNADCLGYRTCGNGIVEQGEVCDDGNVENWDGCSSTCESNETCGNGIIDVREACDDGNTDGDVGDCNEDCSDLVEGSYYIEGTITLDDEGLPGVWVGLTYPSVYSDLLASTTSGRDGSYGFYDLKRTTYSLTPALVNHRFDPSDRIVDIEKSVTGIDFTARKVTFPAHARGSWEVVEHDPVCDSEDCEYEVGAVFTFEDGCLFNEGVDCVEGNRYSAYTGHLPLPSAMVSEIFDGEFFKETQRWVIEIDYQQAVAGNPPVIVLRSHDKITLERAPAGQ
jgi:cysteine-rich repeat protein